jgi:hypothetical protein
MTACDREMAGVPEQTRGSLPAYDFAWGNVTRVTARPDNCKHYQP